MPPPRIRLADLLSRLRIHRSSAPIIPIGFKRGAILTGKFFLTYHLIVSYIGTIGPTAGVSMCPTIPNGYGGFYSNTFILQSRLHRRGRNIHVGDIIVFTHPVNPRSTMAKRVIGMPGDFVSVFTPGRRDEDVEKEESEGDWGNVEERVIQVPEGHCWVAGDNLDWSRDSRVFGPLPLALVKGKVLGVVWPLGAWNWFGSKSQLVDAKAGEKEWVGG
ncbi:LexA/Signal peptidase [Lentithecium fluviatile CBS 122367]|uniref:Mitochondrial inner membrane protease subunit n=1 Tax=Lentithecium fluviatile CBS 122367 TaxID=1168545 RepID=A0A6G1J928_9PLEO|nr:LexA/Signal peptidase [Lentithecium fluviatile CBS 122367]